MKQFKRGASLLLALCLMLNQCMLTVFAEPPSVSLSYTATVTDDYTAGDGIKTVHRGEEITFSLSVSETSGEAYRGVYTVVTFDSAALSYVANSLTAGTGLATDGVTSEDFALVSAGDDLTTAGTLKFAAVHSADQASGTVYATFKLKVTDTAPAGVFPITITRADVTGYDDTYFDADGNLLGSNAGMDLNAIAATPAANDWTHNDRVKIITPAEVTPPTANDLTYNAAGQTLVSGGSATGGTLKYHLSTTVLTDGQLAALGDGDWSETAPSGTNAGTYYVYYKAFGDGDHEDSAAGYVTAVIKPKAVTVTADNKSKAEGDADPELTATVSGTLGSDTVSYTVSRAAGDTAGSYAITPTGDAAQGNYTVTYVPGTLTISNLGVTVAGYSGVYDGAPHSPTATANPGVTFTYSTDGTNYSEVAPSVTNVSDSIETVYIRATDGVIVENHTVPLTLSKAPLTVTANNHSITYGDAPANNGVTYTGFAGSDTAANVTISGSVTYTYTYSQYGDVGNYAITPVVTGLSADNYSFTPSDGVLTVQGKELTFTWSTPTTFTYDGNTKSVTATASNTVNGDVLTLTYTNNSNSDVGDYTATVASISGAKSGNYLLNTTAPTASQSWSIGPAGNSATVNITGWTYGDAANAPTTTADHGADTATYLYKVKGADDSTYTTTVPTQAGDYTVKATILAGGTYSGTTATTNFTIAQKEITLNWSTDPLTYNGSAQAPTATASGTVGGDVIGVTVSGAQTNAGTGYTATASGLTGEKAGNYKLPAANTHTFDIAKATLTVTADNKIATYGDAAPAYTVSYSGWKGSDSAASLTTAPTANSAYAQWSNVGNYTITPSGGTATNYSFSYVNGTLTVNPKNISGATITLADETLNDDGTPKTRTVSSVVVDGRTLTPADYTVSGNTGTAQGDYTMTFTGTGNYTGTATKPWSIGPKAGALLSTIEGYSGVYDAGSHSLTVVKAYDDVTLTYSTNGGASWTTTAPTITNVGTITVTVRATRGTTVEDYVRTLTVTAKAVTVTADDKSKSYGEADPALTATVSGTLGTDTVSYSISRAAGDAAGDYAITPSGAAAQGNYTVTYVPGTLTITQAAANTVTVSITGWTYGAYDATVNGPTATATFGASTVTYSYYTDSACTTPTTAANSGAAADGARPENARTYYVKATVAGTADYAAGTSAAQSFTIGKAPITPVVTLANWLVGSAPNAPAVTAASNPGNGAVTYVYYTDAACTTMTTHDDHGAVAAGEVPAFGGTYYVKATVAETANYQSGTGVKEFKIELFQVVFVDYDGTELKRTGYGTGQTLTGADVPADPVRANEDVLDETDTKIGTTSYVFTGWSPAVDYVNEITDHRIYTAKYTGTYTPLDGSPGYSESVVGTSTITVTQEVDAAGNVKVTTTTETTTTTQKTVGTDTETTEILYSTTTTIETTDSAGNPVPASSSTTSRNAKIVAKVDEKAGTVPVVDDTTYVTGTPDTSAEQAIVIAQTDTTAGAVNSVTLDDVTAAALLMKAVGDYPASTNLLGEVYLQSTLTGYTLATEESGITAVKLIYVVKPFLRVTDLSTPASPVVKENTELKNTDLPTAPPPQITFRLPIPNLFSDLDFVEVEHVSGDLVAYPTPEVTREPIRLDATSGQYYVELTVSHFSTFTLTPSYTITYNLAGGAAANPGSYTISTPTFTLNNPTRGGYTFDGWTGTGLAAATTTVTIPTGSVGDRAYTATWTYAGGGGGGATPPKKDDKDTGGPVSPSVSGVDRLLNTDDHILFIRGYVDGSVQPEGNITRAETAMMLYRLLRNQNVAITQDFSDVADGAWYAEAVRKLASMGIILGYEDGTFLPDKAITRAEFTAMAARFAYATEGKMYFSDVGDGFWAYQQIIAASTYGWINGYEDETFRPQNAITRAEAAAVLNRMLGRKADMPYAMAHEDELVYFFDLRKDKWYYADMVEATNGHDHTGENSTEVWTGIR